MKRKNEKVPGFDEIIFENRNKEYGAYDIRKRYFGATCLSILGGVAIGVTLVLILSFTIERKVPANTGNGPIITLQPDSTLRDLFKIKPDDPEIPKISTYKPVNIEPEIVEKVDSSDVQMAVAGLIPDSAANRPVDQQAGPDNDINPVIPVERPPEIYVEEMPTFPGGNEALMKYIAKELKYPEDAASNGIQGRVTLRFVVSADGSIKRVEILRGIHPALDEEAIRVVSGMPRWKPGKQNGVAVPVWFFVPVNFVIRYN